MQYSMFQMNEVPYCVWEWDLREKNLQYLDQIDPDYFTYIGVTHYGELQGENAKKAALSIRMGYLHGLETLFSLLCGSFQAPDCVVAWMQKYHIAQVREMVRKINCGSGDIFNKLKLKKITWEQLSEDIHIYSNKDSSRVKETSRLFSNLWTRLASDFLDEYHIDEYNSIKHGFRIRSGGFQIRMGEEEEFGVTPPPEKMRWIGGSKYGTSFFKSEEIKKTANSNDKTHFRIHNYGINWDPESLIYALQLISNSINNVISYIKIKNGVKPETVKFNRPQENNAFGKPWETNLGVLKTNFDTLITSDQIKFFNKIEIKDELKKRFGYETK